MTPPKLIKPTSPPLSIPKETIQQQQSDCVCDCQPSHGINERTGSFKVIHQPVESFITGARPPGFFRSDNRSDGTLCSRAPGLSLRGRLMTSIRLPSLSINFQLRTQVAYTRTCLQTNRISFPFPSIVAASDEFRFGLDCLLFCFPVSEVLYTEKALESSKNLISRF
ncbi:hypothetical protein AVEN_236836-1 [Araneus ventricosus]|uniref:Uncharacterized protein n=1 Tax=Araneus ventricosus TaxID=182803 RepID=A0A4Y2KVY0_ARAVE|nr:hypothetical protein AVEN_236836-1 [Araneus ventricosus]